MPVYIVAVNIKGIVIVIGIGIDRVKVVIVIVRSPKVVSPILYIVYY